MYHMPVIAFAAAIVDQHRLRRDELIRCMTDPAGLLFHAVRLKYMRWRQAARLLFRALSRIPRWRSAVSKRVKIAATLLMFLRHMQRFGSSGLASGTRSCGPGT